MLPPLLLLMLLLSFWTLCCRRYSLTLDIDQHLVMHAARAPNGRSVSIETAQPVSGSVAVTVRQCR